MSPERIQTAEAVEILHRSIESLITSVSEHHTNPNNEKLLLGAMTVWTEINENPELHRALEEEFRNKRLAMNQWAQIDISKDPVMRRYNPYQWEDNILIDFKARPGEFYVMRTNTLIEFLNTLKGQE